MTTHPEKHQLGKAGLFGLVILLAVGAALRVLLSPQVPVHANGHGISEMRALVVNPLSDSLGRYPYGRTFITVMGAALVLVGRSERNVYLINAAAGTLSILGMFAVARALNFPLAGALFAALALALSPAQIWLSGSESQMTMHLCFLLAGFSLLPIALGNRDIARLWAGAVLLAVAATMHVATALAIPAVLAFSLRNDGWRDIRLRRHGLACVVLGSALLSYHLLILSPGTARQGLERLIESGGFAFFGRSNILLDPTLTSPLVPILAAAGYALAWRHDRRFVISASAALLFLAPVGFAVDACRTDALRYQAPAQWLYYLLAAFPFAGRVPLLVGRRGHFASAAAAVVLAATSWPAIAWLRSGDEEIREYRFMRQLAAQLPKGIVVRLPAASPNGRLVPDFPDYAGRVELVRGAAPAEGEDGLRYVGDRGLIYLGLDCYRVVPGDPIVETPRGPMRRECLEVCRNQSIPVHETVLDLVPPRFGFQRRFWPLSAEQAVVGLYRCLPFAAHKKTPILDR